MKNLLISLLFVSAALVARAENSAAAPLEGAWELVSAEWPGGKLPGDFSGGLLKIYAADHFAFVGQTVNQAGVAQERYGGGTFTLNGQEYTETVTYHCVGKLVGQSIRFHLAIDGDHLTLTGPIPAPGEKDPGFRLVENFRRVASRAVKN